LPVSRVFAQVSGGVFWMRWRLIWPATLYNASLLSVFLWNPWSAPEATSLHINGLETQGGG